MLSIIAAVDKNWLIGRQNRLPWGHLPADLAHFKKTTMGHTVVMGRRTFESIGQPLAGRTNIVLSSKTKTRVPDSGQEETFIIGGRSVFEQFLPRADRLYLTFIEHEFTGDTYFPPVNWSEWKLVKEETRPPDQKNPWPLRFTVWERA